jgi:capsular exopolysaccharide synthesis family protein
MHPSEPENLRSREYQAAPSAAMPSHGALMPMRGQAPAPWVAAGPPARPPALSAGPDIISLLKALRRRWLLALTAGLLAAGVAGGTVFALMPAANYTTQANVRVMAHASQLLFPTKELHADFNTYRNTQVELIKTDQVLIAALEKEGIYGLATIKEQEDPIEWLSEELDVAFKPNSELLRIGLSGSRPKDLAMIVNAVLDAYRELIVEQETKSREERTTKLQDLDKGYKARLTEGRKKLDNKIKDVGTDNNEVMATKATNDAMELARVKAELTGIQIRINKAKAERQVREEEMKRLVATAESPQQLRERIEAALGQDSEVHDLRERMAATKKALDGAQRRVRNPRDPSVTPHRKRLESLQTEHDRLVSAKQDAYAKEVRSTRTQGIRQDVERLRQIQKALELEEQSVRGMVKEVTGQSKKFGLDTVELANLRDEIAYADGAARKIAEELEILKVEREAPERIIILNRARTPLIRDAMKQMKVAGGAAVVAFLAVLAGISLWEFRARRINTPEEVIEGLGLRLVGALPALPSGSRSLRAVDQKRHNLLVESVDAARSLLLHAARQEATRVVMITSAVKGEGKTTLAGHLATSLARAGRRTVLVDCDLRNPAVHRLFDVPVDPGLSEVLLGQIATDDVVRPTVANGLWVVSAGGCDPQAVQAVASGGLGPIFDWLRQRFDFVIVDTAPVLPVADTLSVSDHVDATIFSVMRDVSRGPRVYAAYERLASLGVRVLGAVIAGGLADRDDYYNYQYSGNGQAAGNSGAAEATS